MCERVRHAWNDDKPCAAPAGTLPVQMGVARVHLHVRQEMSKADAAALLLYVVQLEHLATKLYDVEPFLCNSTCLWADVQLNTPIASNRTLREASGAPQSPCEEKVAETAEVADHLASL